MSTKARAWAQEQVTGDPALKLLLITIADFADDDGYSWPGRRLLARLCEVHERSIVRYVRRLQELGLLAVERRMLDNGALTSNAYRFPMAARQLGLLATPVADCHPPRGSAVTSPVTQPCHPPRGTGVTCIEPSREPSGEKQQKALLPERPDWLPPEWDEFVADRKERGKKLTSRATALALTTLARLRAEGHAPAAVLRQSIENGWSGLFALKGERRPHPPVASAVAEAAALIQRGAGE